MKVYEALARSVAEESTNVVFTLLGDGNMSWSVAMGKDHDIELIHARHENAAVAMADGYARATGKVGVCSITCGPGITQIPTSLTCAARAASPLVVLAGDTPQGASYHLQQFDPGPLVRSTGAHHLALRHGDHATEDVREAFYVARTRKVPVVLTAPYDIQEQEYRWEWTYTPSASIVYQPQTVHPAPEELQELAAVFGASQRPVLLAGYGAMRAGAKEVLEELSHQSGALLATTLRAKDLFLGHPRNLGLAGAFASPRARELLSHADLVVAFGASLGHYTTEAGYLFQAAEVVQVDESPSPVKDGSQTAGRFVTGDARLVAEFLLSQATARRNVGDEWQERGSESALEQIDFIEPTVTLDEGTVDPRTVMAELSPIIPVDWTVIIGAGHFWNFAVQYLTGRSPDRYIYTAPDFGAVGQGVGVAIGAAMREPRSGTILVEGDGSLIMNIQELETIGRHQLDVKIVVLNDGAYGAEVHKLIAAGLPGDEAIFGSPELIEIAKACGMFGVRVDASSEDRVDILRQALATPGPVLIDIRISPSVRSAQYRRVFFGESV